MKKLLTIVILIIPFYNVSAQFLQSVNKKAEVDIINNTPTNNLKNINQSKLLGFDGEINARAAGIFVKDCDKKIRQLNEKLKSEEKANSSFKEKNENINQITDSIEIWNQLKQELIALNSLGGTPKFGRKFIPLRSIEQAKYFYFTNNLNQKEIKLVSDLVAQRSFDGTVALSSNVLTGIVPIEHLPVKINISTTVSQTKDSTATNKANAKLPYGGLVNINLSYPLFYSSKEKDKGKYTTFYMPIEIKYHLDDVKDKAQFKDTYHYFEASTSLYISADLIQQNNEENVTIFANPNLAYYYGGSVFKQKIGYNNFWISQLNIGIKLAKQFTLGANIPLYSSQKEIKDKQNASLALIFEPK